MRAHDPAAAHFAGRPLEIRIAKAQTREDCFRFGFDLIAAQVREARVQIIVIFGFGVIVVPGMDQLLELRKLGGDRSR